LAIVVVIIGLGSGCASTRPVLQGVDARILQVDATGVDIALDLDVKNQLPIALKSGGGAYGLDIAGTPFLNWDEVPALELPASQVGTLTLPARLEYASLITTFKDLAMAREVAYRIHGSLKFPMIGGDFDLPFTHEGNVPGPAEALRNRAKDLLDLP
jgi:hypothetical protein